MKSEELVQKLRKSMQNNTIFYANMNFSPEGQKGNCNYTVSFTKN